MTEGLLTWNKSPMIYLTYLKELNLEVLDTSWTNLHCANEECTKFAVVDVGASVSGERSRILQGVLPRIIKLIC